MQISIGKTELLYTIGASLVSIGVGCQLNSSPAFVCFMGVFILIYLSISLLAKI